MNNITARFGLLFISFLLPATNVLGATSADHKITCEQVGDLALKVMYKRQSAEQLDPPESSMSWEDKILAAGLNLRASQVLISSDPDEKLDSIVKFGESIYDDCKSGKLGLLQQYAGNQPAPTVQNVNAQLFDVIEMLQTEVQSLRGFVEELAFNVNHLKTEQKQRYLDLDRRIVALMDQPVVEQDNQAAMAINTDSTPQLNIGLPSRVSMLEKEYDSIASFRQTTNKKLNQLQTQIRSLTYGADNGVLQQLAEVQQALDSLSVDEGTSINNPDNTELITAAVNYMKDEIGDNWVRPANARNGMVVELVIRLVPTGEVVDVEVSYRDPSATDAFVASVVNAVKTVRRLDELSQLSSELFDANFRRFTIRFKPEDLRL
jgi:hypothetical protein